MMRRGYNFSAGPATLPESLLQEAQAELLDWKGIGRSVMEISHRSSEFIALIQEAEVNLRSLLGIPSNYHILWFNGPARQHFSMVPLNFSNHQRPGGYLTSGIWSKMAFDEGKRLGNAYCLASSEMHSFKQTPDLNKLEYHPDTAYVFFTPNETVDGNRFPTVPKTNGIPLIADMTSCLLSEPIDVSSYALIFAGAQKNISIAGLTLVIIRDDLLQETTKTLPVTMDYFFQSNHFLYATPPTFNCYLAAKMFDWLQKQGGITTLFDINQKKAALLYDYLDKSDFYCPRVENPYRSIMNVCFEIRADKRSLTDLFLNEANHADLFGLKGHRLVGGLRASLYNAMPLKGVATLLEFMETFARRYA